MAGLLNSSSLLAQLDSDWERLSPLLLGFNSTPAAQRGAAALQLRQRYLSIAALGSAAGKDGLVRLFGDRHVLLPALQAAQLHAAATKQPVYVYRFSWNAAQVEYTQRKEIQHSDFFS